MNIYEKSKSKAQRRLMGMAYAYKTGKLKDIPDSIKKIADKMNLKDLKDFAKTKEKDLPKKVRTKSGKPDKRVKQNKPIKESVLFLCDSVLKFELDMLFEWFNINNIKYNFYSDYKILEIENIYLSESQENIFDFYLNNIEVMEDVATLSNTIGMGAINPPASGLSNSQPSSDGRVGSGDRFDNSNYEDDEKENNGKKKKKKLQLKKDNISNNKLPFYQEFINKK